MINKDIVLETIAICDSIVRNGLDGAKLNKQPEPLQKYKSIVKPKIDEFSSKNGGTPNRLLDGLLKEYVEARGLTPNFRQKGFPAYGQVVRSYFWACIYKAGEENNYRLFPQLYVLINSMGIKMGFDYGVDIDKNARLVDIVKNEAIIQEKIINALRIDQALQICSDTSTEGLPKTTDRRIFMDRTELAQKWSKATQIIKYYAQDSIPANIDVIIRDTFDVLLGLFRDISLEKPIEEINPPPDKNKTLSLLLTKKQIILYGPPGTGKTYTTRQIALNLLRWKK